MTGSNLTLDYIRQRSSIRAYQDRPLTSAEMEALKEAALAAPTARNRQQLRYSFVANRAILDAIDSRIFHFCDPQMKTTMDERESTSFFYGAPLAVFITGQDEIWTPIDAGIAVQTLAIAAQSMGLSSVILGYPRLAFKPDDPDNCGQLIGMEEGEVFKIAIAIGHAATRKEPHTSDPAHIRVFD